MRTNLPIVPGVLLIALALTPVTVAAQQKVQLPARDKMLADKPAQIFSIGEEEGEDWEMLSQVRGVAFDASDNLYVLDGGNYRVLVFDANGKFVRKIGKQGAGPGELQAPVSMTVATDGTIVVGDFGTRGYVLFKPDGTFIKNVLFEDGTMPAMGGSAAQGGSAIQAHPRGGVLSRVNPMMVRMGGAGQPGANLGAPTGERKSPVNWWNLGTGKSSQLHEFTLPSVTPRVVESGGAGAQRRVAVTIQATNWQPQINLGVLPTGGIAFYSQKEYSVSVTDATGKVERVIERPIAPKKGTDKDKQAFMERQRANMSSGATQMMSVRMGGGGTSFSTAPGRSGGDLPSIDEMMRNATWEEYIPVLRNLTTDPQGRIWIARTPADFAPRGPVDIVRADGSYVGTIANEVLPGAVSRTGRAAYVERDDLNVEHVVVKRLPSSWQ